MYKKAFIGEYRAIPRRVARFVVSVLAMVATIHAAAQAAPTAPPTVIDVRVSRGELTVDVRNAPLDAVLRTIGQKVGVDVSLRGDLSAPVTLSFAGLPLDEGIRRLAPDHSVAVTYGVSEGNPERQAVTGVWVIAGGPARGASKGSVPATASTSVSPTVADSGPTSGATASLPLADRTREIQTLAGQALQGSEGAVALLAIASASEPDASLRQQALAALARVQGPAVEPVLTAALGDEDASIRARAVRGLRELATDTAVRSLAGVIGDADSQVRLAAVRALASFPGPLALKGLARASSDPDELVRDTAIQALSWWNTRVHGAPR